MYEFLAFPPELLTKKMVAYLLSTSESGVMRLVHQNKLPVVDDGSKWLKFRLTDVREYVKNLPDRPPVKIASEEKDLWAQPQHSLSASRGPRKPRL